MANRTQTNFLQRDDVLQNFTPKVVVQRDVSAPSGNWRPAAWLPVQFTKHNVAVGETAYVISSGKVVAMDSEGKIVPAGIRALLKAGAAALVYTALDVKWGTTDLVTGQRVTSPVTYSTTQVAVALVERGLVSATEAAEGAGTVPATTTASGSPAIDAFISGPVGFSAYDIYAWSGLPEEGDQHFTNFSLQHAIQFLTEAQLQLPQLVAGSESADSFVVATLNTGGTETYAAGTQIGSGEFFDATNASQFSKYELLGLSASSPVVALGLDVAGDHRVAKNTTRTPFTCNTANVLVRERNSPAAISKAGDWWLDEDGGVLFLHEDTWTAGVTATATWVFSYGYYDDAASSAHKQVHFDGVAKPGQRVTFDAQSNFVAAGSGTAESDILGRVLRVDVQPSPLLGAVKTGFTSSVKATAQMPGSATGGYTDLITLSDEVVADRVVIVNFRI